MFFLLLVKNKLSWVLTMCLTISLVLYTAVNKELLGLRTTFTLICISYIIYKKNCQNICLLYNIWSIQNTVFPSVWHDYTVQNDTSTKTVPIWLHDPVCRLAYTVHAVNHVLKTRARILKNNEKEPQTLEIGSIFFLFTL